MATMSAWPKKEITWLENRVLYVSIPFTWRIDSVRDYIKDKSLWWDSVAVGGPAVFLVPGAFSDLSHVSEGHSLPGVLQRANPQATRTTTGCPNGCAYCGVSKIEPVFSELSDWPDLPVLCDNNILAASQSHFDRVCDRLERHGWCDFNQGLDVRLLTSYHAERFKRIGNPVIRLALDSPGMRSDWEAAFCVLRNAGIPKRLIRSYCLVGYADNPDTAWESCKFVENFGVKALPMWYHALDIRRPNTVTEAQKVLGWNDYERRRIMQWFYKHRDVAKPRGKKRRV